MMQDQQIDGSQVRTKNLLRMMIKQTLTFLFERIASTWR